MTKQQLHSEGLRFKKLDLHLHTPASKCFADRTVTAADIVKKAVSKGLDAIAVTDHNSGAWVDDVKQAAAGTQLVIFPGAEITCMGGKEGIHVIALFDISSTSKDVESLLGNLGLKPSEYGDIRTVVQKDPIAVADIISERGGLAILAHANSSKGALQDMRGEQRTRLIQCPAIKGVEATDFQDSEARGKHRRVVDVLDGHDPTYQRKLAVYQASDNPSGTVDGKHGIAGIGTRCAYFKLDRIDLDGVRQCLADPDVRIRQDFEYSIVAYPSVRKIKISGGFLDGAEAIFHEGLNSILGGKGAGKSLLIEFLRFALNQQPSNEDIRADHDNKLEHRLENYGAIEVTIRDETGHEFTIKRVWDPAEGFPYEGEVVDPEQSFPVLFLSQNEIIKIAESEDQQIAFIDQFFDFRSYQQKIADLGAEIDALDDELEECLTAFLAQRELEKSIGTANKEIAKLDESLKNPIFDQYTKHEAKERSLREHLKFITDLSAQVATTENEYDRIKMPDLPATHSTDPALRRSAAIIAEAKKALLQKLAEGANQLAQSKQQLDNEYAKWTPDFQRSRKSYADVVQKEGGDYKNLAQKRAKSVKNVEALQQKLAIVRQKSDQTKQISADRDRAIESLKQAYEAYSKERQNKCETIEKESAGRLKIRIHEASNVEQFQTRLWSLKKGSYLKDVEVTLICEKTDPGTFVKAVLRHSIFGKSRDLDSLADTVGIARERMVLLAEFLHCEFPLQQILALEHKALPKDRPEILYNVGEGKFEPLSRLSVGQKCTAMLIVALSEGSFPIIIDQPEDSLDIRTIWEDMCSKIRRGKERRQFIFTTHNSSLAVASDTDKFTILEAGAMQGRVMYSGSMDHSPINAEVITYLEGGPDTYKTKYGKYRIDTDK